MVIEKENNSPEVHGIEINGHIDMSDNPMTHKEFCGKFIQFIESNKWYFGGGIAADEEVE